MGTGKVKTKEQECQNCEALLAILNHIFKTGNTSFAKQLLIKVGYKKIDGYWQKGKAPLQPESIFREGTTK